MIKPAVNYYSPHLLDWRDEAASVMYTSDDQLLSCSEHHQHGDPMYLEDPWDAHCAWVLI